MAQPPLLLLLFLATQGVYYYLEPSLTVETRLVLKPLPMVVTMLSVCYQHGRNTPVWLLLGLVFSLVGDVALVFPGPLAFLAGLGSFAVAHMAYIVAFLQKLKHKAGASEVGSAPFLLRLLHLLPCAFLVYRICYADPASAASQERDFVLFGAVHFYAFLLTAMALKAADYWFRHGAFGTWVGAVLFVVSDSILGLTNLAKVIVPYSPYLIISTYWWAQWLIAHGLAQSHSRIGSDSQKKTE